MNDLGRDLEGMRLADMRQGPGIPSGPGWAEEFHRAGPGPLVAPHELDAEFERIYQQQQGLQHLPPSAWEQEFLTNPAQFHQPPLRPEEILHFERLYQSVSTEPKIRELDEFEEAEGEGVEKGKARDWAEEFQETEARYGEEEEEVEAPYPEMEEMWRQIKEAQAQGNFNFDDEEEIWNNSSMVNPFGQSVVEDKPYEFEPDNPFMDHPHPMEEGLRLMDSGNLSDAALAFEAEVQINPKNAEAWYRLGAVQQENEKEQPAIVALHQAVQLDPHNLDATLALAVSYTNEGAESQALDALENWIRIRCPEHQFPPYHAESGQLRYEYVVDLYLQIVRRSASIVPDVQVGLGVLFNISNEFDKAVDCFAAALQERPNDYVLWNRLGATLANGGRSEEAIDAYYKALRLKPSFVRARYNVGVSCINIGCYREAAEHFLGALALHGDTNNRKNVSNNLWDTLRRTFLLMERRELFEKTNQQNLDLFRGEFEF